MFIQIFSQMNNHFYTFCIYKQKQESRKYKQNIKDTKTIRKQYFNINYWKIHDNMFPIYNSI